ncbi:hypothetical protein GS540_29355, partial [Rhodococcus hoagii]|nr:hypothetical protein [Prescottella equi]
MCAFSSRGGQCCPHIACIPGIPDRDIGVHRVRGPAAAAALKQRDVSVSNHQGGSSMGKHRKSRVGTIARMALVPSAAAAV